MSSEIGLFGDLFEAIFQVFSSFCKQLTTLNFNATEQQQDRCRNELERLFLWADGVSIQDGDLDEILSQSPALRSNVLLIILNLGNAVCKDLCELMSHNEDFTVTLNQEIKIALTHLDKAQTALQEEPAGSDSESPESPDLFDDERFEPDFNDVLENITTVIDCLMDLSLALERPMQDEAHPEASGTAETFKVEQPAFVYCRKIRDRFQNLPLYLVERLGSANLQRANMLREIKDLIQPAEENSRFMDESLFSKSIPQVTDTTKSAFAKDSIFSSNEVLRRPVTDFETNSEATFASFSTSTSSLNQGRPRVPPLPEEAENGSPYMCEYCAKMIRGVITRRQWKSHVFEDIQPYMCTFEDCEDSETLFRTSRSWARHQNQHAEQQNCGAICPFCGATISSNTGAFYRHVGRHLREISLAVLPQTTSSESEVDSDSDEPSPPPTARRDFIKQSSRSDYFEPTDIFKHRYQDPSVLITYLKSLPDKFRDTQITVRTMNGNRLGLRLPRKLEKEEVEGVLQAFIEADRHRQLQDDD